jgi:hypothetical protein
MERRVWTGVIAGVLAAAALLTVGIGAYRAGQDDEVVARTVEGDEVVRVVDDGRDFFPGFFLFPLLIIGLIVLLARGRRGWHRPYGPGWGPGPGYYGGRGPGPWGPGGCDPEGQMREWHRRMHEGEADAPADEPRDDEPASASAPHSPGEPAASGRSGGAWSPPAP